MNVHAIILAAGKSSRMGKSKQLLDLYGKPVLEHVIDAVLDADFTSVTAVIGNEAEKIKSSIKKSDPRFRWVVNDTFDQGQSTSVRKGIESIGEEIVNAMLFLGDMPLIKKETIHRLLQTGIDTMRAPSASSCVIRPSFQRKPGHPVFFVRVSRTLFQSIHGDKGAKPIMKYIDAKKLIVVDDIGIHFDLDTIEDYERAIEIFAQHEEP